MYEKKKVCQGRTNGKTMNSILPNDTVQAEGESSKHKRARAIHAIYSTIPVHCFLRDDLVDYTSCT